VDSTTVAVGQIGGNDRADVWERAIVQTANVIYLNNLLCMIETFICTTTATTKWKTTKTDMYIRCWKNTGRAKNASFSTHN